MKRYLLLVCCLLFLGGCGDSNSVSSETSTKSIFYFTGDSPTHLPALWKSDGTTAGTQLVETFYTPPANLLQVGDKVFFVADYPHSIVGVWQSNGSSEGTFALAGPFAEISDLIAVNGNLYFLVRNFSQQSELWQINLVSHEALLINAFAKSDYFGRLQKNGNSLLLSINYTDRNELWISDGTTEGSRLFATTENSADGISWGPSDHSGKAFFFKLTRSDPLAVEASLWLTDGTEAGTTLVKSASGEGAVIGLIGNLSDKLLLFVTDQGQPEYWGIDKGTAMAEKLSEIPTDQNSQRMFPPHAGRNCFFVVNRTDTGRKELWVTDGSSVGTKVLKSFTDYGVDLLRGMEEQLFFMVWPTANALPSLWTSDGTSTGTRKIIDVTAEKPCMTDKFLYFDGTSYYFLNQNFFFWKTNSIEAGTNFIKNLAAP